MIDCFYFMLKMCRILLLPNMQLTLNCVDFKAANLFQRHKFKSNINYKYVRKFIIPTAGVSEETKRTSSSLKNN